MWRIRAGMLALTTLASALAACAAPTAAPTVTTTASATPSAIPDVVSTRLMAELIGQLEQVDGCWRVQARNDPTYSVLLVLPADFDAAPSGDALRMSDLLLKQQTTWHVGDIIDIAGGNIPGLGPGLRPIGLPTCSGPYWVVGSIDPSATPTPTAPAPATLAVATTTPASSATPFSVFALVAGSEAANGLPAKRFAVVILVLPGADEAWLPSHYSRCPRVLLESEYGGSLLGLLLNSKRPNATAGRPWRKYHLDSAAAR